MGFAAFGNPELVLALLLGLLVDAITGRWISRVVPTPSHLAERACVWLERHLNRAERGEKTRLVRGLLVVLALVAIALAVGSAAHALGRACDRPWLVDLAILIVSLGGGAAWDRARQARRAMEARDAKIGLPMLRSLTRRPIDERDGHALVRIVIEYLAKAFDRRVIAPAFWYLLAGIPGLLVWSVVDGADQGLGAPGIGTSAFGLTAARLDDALNALPARLAALALALAALFLGGANCPRALRTAWRDATRSASFNMGWPIAAVAGALDLSLVGPYRDGGVVVNEAWIGDGRARATPPDIGRALALTGLAGLLAMLGIGMILVMAAGL